MFLVETLSPPNEIVFVLSVPFFFEIISTLDIEDIDARASPLNPIEVIEKTSSIFLIFEVA